eukprot:gene4904-5552_t
MDANATAVQTQEFFMPASMVLPAIMTLVCFICTVMSLTVAGFICLRDKEAKDQNEVTIKQQREDEFVSKAVSLFYNVRTFNVFRVNDIIEDKNENKPAWLSRKDRLIKTLQLYGVFLSENEDKEISSSSDVFEIDTEALFYLELERFSRALAIYGDETLKYFPSIAQDGMVFRKQFTRDKREIYESHLIHTILKEMQKITDLFVLLLTGIDAGLISNKKLPEQFKMCMMKEELCCLEDFFYNYYHRMYSQSGLRPNSDLTQSAHVANLSGEKRKSQAPIMHRADSIVMDTMESERYDDDYDVEGEGEKPAQPENIIRKVRRAYHAVQAAQKMKMKKRKQSISTRSLTPLESKQGSQEQLESSKGPEIEPFVFEAGGAGMREDFDAEQATSTSQSASLSARTEQITTRKQQESEASHGQQPPRHVKNPWSRRRRGKLKSPVNLERNAFTFMVFKVLECLKGNSFDIANYQTKRYNQVDKNFII